VLLGGKARQPRSRPQGKLCLRGNRCRKVGTVWFMAVGRDRDQRRCQLLSRQAESPHPPPLGSSSLSPRNPTPSRGHQRRAGECEEFSRHICTFSPLPGCEECRRRGGGGGCDHLAVHNETWGREAAMSGGSRQFGRTGRRASGMARRRRRGE